MEIIQEKIITESIKFSVQKGGEEIGVGFLCLFKNSKHKDPFGLMEDIYINEEYRGQKIGTKLVNAIIEEAKKQKCYKLIATSRYAREKVHEFYLRLGFEDWGKEFRMNIK